MILKKLFARRTGLALLLFAILALGFSGCNSPERNVNESSEKYGGVSGGGGGTVPSNLVDAASIHTAIEQSRSALYLYFNNQDILRRTADVPSANLLFGGTKTIFDIIKTASIELNEYGTCRDPSNKEKDGAAPGSKPNSICISVKNLTSKLTTDNYWDQTVALIGHEFSHLEGADEAQAVVIQRDIINSLGQWRPAVVSNIVINGAMQIHKLLTNLDNLEKFPSEFASSETLNQLLLHNVDLIDSILSSNVIFANNLSAFNANESDVWWGVFWKLQMLSDWACSEDHSSNNFRADVCKDNLDHFFRTDSQLTLPEVERRMNSGSSSQNPPSFAIRRITTTAIFTQEVSDLVRMLGEIDRTLQGLPRVISGYESNSITPVPTNNAIGWKTNRVSIIADDFHIWANGIGFYGTSDGGELHSDKGLPSSWTFESIWMENGREMRLYIYFQADSDHWWANEIDTYNGQLQGDWVTYAGRFFESPLGKAFSGNLDLTSGNNAIHLTNLKLQFYLH